MRIEDWRRSRQLLCVRLDAMGDVLMTGPAIRALKQAVPGRTITLLTSSAGRDTGLLLPDVDCVVTYDAPWMKATAARVDAAPDLEMIGSLREMRLEAAVIFTVYTQSPLPAALLCYLAGVPLRIAHCRENPYQLLTDWVAETEPEREVRHEVRRQLDLAAASGAVTSDERMSIRMRPAALAKVRELLREMEIRPDRPWAVVHPGATAASRRYPPDLLAQAVRRLKLLDGWQIVFTGSAEEGTLIDEVRSAAGIVARSLAGRLNLEELAALLSLTPVLIANNTGPVHVAAALGTPVVDIYALTNPQHTPWMTACRVLSHDVPCKYCYKSVCPQGHNDCLTRIAPAEVARAAFELVEETRAARLSREAVH